MSSSEDKLSKSLQLSGLRVTKSRIAVLSVLEENKGSFLTPEKIFETITKIKKINIDRASVYRILNALLKINLVKVSHFQGEASKYQIHFHDESHDDCHYCDYKHEHYFKCIKCDALEPIEECFVDKSIKQLEKRGFHAIGHHLEISGYCPNCL